MPAKWFHRKDTRPTVEQVQNRANQFASDPTAAEPAPREASRSVEAAVDGVELIRTEWFTSLVSSGVQACATFEVTAGPIHFDTKRQCVSVADLAAAYQWLLGLAGDTADANGVKVKSTTASALTSLATSLATIAARAPFQP